MVGFTLEMLESNGPMTKSFIMDMIWFNYYNYGKLAYKLQYSEEFGKVLTNMVRRGVLCSCKHKHDRLYWISNKHKMESKNENATRNVG